MSIHKAQGKSLERVIVNLQNVFESGTFFFSCLCLFGFIVYSGQVYVALSRAVSTDGLQILNFGPDKVSISRLLISGLPSMAMRLGPIRRS